MATVKTTTKVQLRIPNPEVAIHTAGGDAAYFTTVAETEEECIARLERLLTRLTEEIDELRQA